MPSFPLVLHTLTAAVRDKMIIALFLAVVLSCSLSVFLGGVAVIEQDYFSIVFTAAGLRFSVVLGLVLFVVFYIRRSFDNKDVEFLLSRPISRVQFVASYIVAFIVLAVVMTLTQAGCLYAMAPHLFGAGHVLWVISVLAENVIMVSIALFFAMYLSSAATAALGCLAFYALARLIGQVLGVIDAGISLPGADFISALMNGISLVIPRLDLMAQSSWLVYGVTDPMDFGIVIAQGVIFSVFVFLAASIDLVRRQF